MSVKTVNLIKILVKKGMILFFILFYLNGIKAQFNSEIGYTVSYMPAEFTNEIIDAYNANTVMLTEMKELKYVSGFNAGLTYRTGIFKFGAFWESISSKRTGVEGTLNTSAKNRDLYFNFNALSGGLELQYHHIGIGATTDYNMHSIKTSVTGSSSKISILKKNYYSNKVYIILHFKATDKFGVALKPYVRFPWTDVSLYPLADYLNVNKIEDYNTENFIQFGISMSILNGTQPDY